MTVNRVHLLFVVFAIIDGLGVLTILLMYAMMEVCIRKHVKGSYDSLIFAWDKTLFRMF
jgi:hypothetical protein